MSQAIMLLNPELDVDGGVALMQFFLVGPAYLRALAKSDEQARAGNLPRLVEIEPDDGTRHYAVSSRLSTDVYLVVVLRDVDGETGFGCDCKAGVVPRLCWHVLHVHRALDNLIGSFSLPEVHAAIVRKES